jgi:hypothetical protein
LGLVVTVATPLCLVVIVDSALGLVVTVEIPVTEIMASWIVVTIVFPLGLAVTEVLPSGLVVTVESSSGLVDRVTSAGLSSSRDYRIRLGSRLSSNRNYGIGRSTSIRLVVGRTPESPSFYNLPLPLLPVGTAWA